MNSKNDTTKLDSLIPFLRYYFPLCFLFFLVIQVSVSQENKDSLELRQYYQGFPFTEGIYSSFDQFRDNNPLIQVEFERRGSQLYVMNDSLGKMVRVNPDKVWGYSNAGNIYVSKEDAYWRIINIGALCQFTAITITTFQTVDSFGFPVEQQSKSLQQLFLDFNTGEVYVLSHKNLQPYIDQDPMLAQRFKRLKRQKGRELIIALKAYNEIHPIYFPVYE